MTTVAIISEYNPFHSGHEYHITKIREEFGSDTAIIAIMSGNYTQRGEAAILGKAERAKCALLGGVDLVVELPFPYSSESAEIFAKSGVRIADALGCVDYLSFGTESGSVHEITEAAEIIDTDEFRAAFAALGSELGYPERCEAAFRSARAGTAISFTPNNILAIEYVRALRGSGSKIRPHTVKREGAGYLESNIASGTHQSAMAIREKLSVGDDSALTYIPEAARAVIQSSVASGDIPCSLDRLSAAIISHLRLNPPSPSVMIHDAGDGLYNRLHSASLEANDISSLIDLTETKNYTRARIRRVVLYAFFGVTSSDALSLPCYTQVLAMNEVGMLLLKKTRKMKKDGFFILTKPSSTDQLNGIQLSQKLMADKADSVFELTKPRPKSGRAPLRLTPFIKK